MPNGESIFFSVWTFGDHLIQTTSLGFLQGLGSSTLTALISTFIEHFGVGEVYIFWLHFMGKNYLLTLAKCKGAGSCAGVWQLHGRGVTVWSDRLDTATSFPFSVTVRSRHQVYRWEWKQTYFGMSSIQFCMVQLTPLLLTSSNITQFSKHLWNSGACQVLLGAEKQRWQDSVWSEGGRQTYA